MECRERPNSNEADRQDRGIGRNKTYFDLIYLYLLIGFPDIINLEGSYAYCPWSSRPQIYDTLSQKQTIFLPKG